MSSSSNIEWTDATWNPIVGCSIKSPGCIHCYAMKMARRIELMGTAPHYAGLTDQTKAGPVFNGKLALAPYQILTAPLRWKKPKRIFVNSMGDLFHEDAPDEWIDKVFAVMALCPQHQFQVLTKRAERMREYFSDGFTQYRIALSALKSAPGDYTFVNCIDVDPWRSPSHAFERWPLPNVWLGVSAERQQEADERIPHLLQTPAAIRFVSCEPLIGPIDLTFIRHLKEPPPHIPNAHIDALKGYNENGNHTKLDWIIVGGESGPGARPMHPDWARSLRDQCGAAGVPFFFKQWGNWKNGSDFASDDSVKAVLRDGRVVDPDLASLKEADRVHQIACQHATLMRNVGKKAAGRLLDGKEHNGMPG